MTGPVITRQQVNQIIRATLHRPAGWSVVILVAIMFASAIAVVVVKDQYRQSFIALQQWHIERQKLNVTWRQLLLEKTTWANYGRMEQAATQQMDMQGPAAKDSRILVIPPAGSSDAQAN